METENGLPDGAVMVVVSSDEHVADTDSTESDIQEASSEMSAVKASPNDTQDVEMVNEAHFMTDKVMVSRCQIYVFHCMFVARR